MVKRIYFRKGDGQRLKDEKQSQSPKKTLDRARKCKRPWGGTKLCVFQGCMPYNTPVIIHLK